MATQQANGGASMRWVDAHGWRLVLCHNGMWLINNGGGRWRKWREQPSSCAAFDAMPNRRRWMTVAHWRVPLVRNLKADPNHPNPWRTS